MSLRIWKVASRQRATKTRPVALGIVLVVLGALVLLAVQFSPIAVASPAGIMVVTLTSPNALFRGDFGDSVAVSGTTVVVGAPRETVKGDPDAGHSYLFDAKTGALISTLTSPNAQKDGFFGASVAVSGTTAVVGASGEIVKGASAAGHAYEFNAETGALIRTLTSPNAQSGGTFGVSVAISGSTAVVGASGETAKGVSAAGHAYEFNAKTGTLIRTLSSPNAQEPGYFGDSVAVSSTTVVVGADYETPSGQTYAGHVYTFNAKTGALFSTLTSPNAQQYGYSGTSVAISGSTTVVGAPYETANGLTDGGHAYEFNAKTGTLIRTLTSPIAPKYVDDGGFGYSVFISGTTVIVGGYGESADGFSEAGHAFTFNAKTGALISTLTSLNTLSKGFFGASVAVSGTTVVVGAPGETASGLADAGHAYIF
ncbi:MAG: hypothetical protein WA688_02730 [Thermoplasmata archaeon]